MANNAPLKWFETWFGTPYYHLLYQNRSTAEADNFIKKLLAYLQPSAGSNMLDVACGAGRHALALAQYGYDVTGVDINAANILQARTHSNAHLHFYIQDMRSMGYVNHFDYVFNLFTSFGYFNHTDDNHKAARSMAQALRRGGRFTIDFINGVKAIKDMVPEAEVQRGALTFKINKEVVNDTIVKTISLTDESGQQHRFQERVQTFSKEALTQLFETYGLSLIASFGDYNLAPFDTIQSPRIILIFEK